MDGVGQNPFFILQGCGHDAEKKFIKLEQRKSFLII